MSLPSRVFGLFSTTATSDQTTTPELSTKATQRFTTNNDMITAGASRHVREEALFEDEPRPPYLHVRSAIPGHSNDQCKANIISSHRRCWRAELEDPAVIC